MHKLATLPLTKVEVSVGDDDPHVSPVEALWTAANVKEYDEGIREILLDPVGAQKYVQEQEESKKYYEQEVEMRRFQALKDAKVVLP